MPHALREIGILSPYFGCQNGGALPRRFMCLLNAAEDRGGQHGWVHVCHGVVQLQIDEPPRDIHRHTYRSIARGAGLADRGQPIAQMTGIFNLLLGIVQQPADPGDCPG